VVESIEVIRGAGSALYGANASWASINIVTKKPKEQGAFLEAGVEPGTIRSNLSWKTNGHLLGSVTFADRPLSYILISARHDQFDPPGCRFPAARPIKQTTQGVQVRAI